MRKIITTALVGLFLTSYAHASDKNSNEVKALVQKQTGSDVSSLDINKEIEGLLGQALTEDAVVKITFLNSSLIKAQLSSLGISEADMREAGILHNPTLRFSSRTSSEEGAKRNNEIEVKQDVMDVLFWPLRKKAAGTRFKAAQYEAAQKITDLLKAAKLSYLEWVTAVNKQKLAQDHFKAQEAALEIARRQKEAGNINILQIDGAQAIFQKAKIEWLKTQLDTQTLSQRLRTILGLKPDQFFMDEPMQMQDLPKENLVLADLEKKVLDHRLDLAMKHQEIKSLEQSVNLSAAGVQPIEVGYDQETETSGNKLKGIVIEGQLPVFNRNQGQRMGINASIETAKHQLDAMEQQALLEVRLAYQKLSTSRQIVDSYKETIPVYQQMVKETLYGYNFMLKDVFRVLEAKQAELETQEAYVDALKEYWISRAELEYALGSKLPVDLPVKAAVNQSTPVKNIHGG